MAADYFNQGRFEIASQSLDLENDIIKVAKMSTAYTPDIDSHQYYADISDFVVGTDVTLTNIAITKNDTDNAADVDADDVSESDQTVEFNRLVYYKWTTVPATSPLIAWADVSEGTVSATSGDVNLTFSTRGILSI